MRRSRIRGIIAAVMAIILIPAPAGAEQPAAVPSAEDDGRLPAPPARASSSVDPDQRAEILGQGWQGSADRAWTLVGDADGLHVLVADASGGYSWRTAATLSETGFDVDQWIGNGCVTGSGQRLVVVYAPRTFTNKEHLSSRGGFTAVVDLASGAVSKLPVQTSLAYFNPGCGVDETVILTLEGINDLGKTRVMRLDAATAMLGASVDIPGQLTSAVPVSGGIIAADGDSLVRVDGKGARTLLAATSTVPSQVMPDAEGGVVFLDQTSEQQVAVRRAIDGQAPSGSATLATGQLSQLGLVRGAAGKVFVTGVAETVAHLPAPVVRLDVAKNAEMSTLGDLAITRVQRADQPDPRAPVNDPTRARPVQLEAKSVRTGKLVHFTVDPAAQLAPQADTGRSASPALAGGAGTMTPDTGSPTDPVDTDRWCSVPRNDPRNQTYQPKPRQVEWAVDQAVRGVLNVQRPANWKNLGMPAYTPQSLLPNPGLDGGGFVPAQIMLGIAAQESNLWQASRVALPGVTANPLIGNFYGRPIYDSNPDDDWDVHWDKADCGYGVTQVTDGMRLAGHQKPGETPFPYQTQRAIALDFAANIAAGLQILERKWNEVRQAGMQVNNGDPQYIENWFFAVWAYNSGFHPNRGDGSPWGVGWLNNPSNPRYPPGRDPFLEYTYDDARHPQHWPYPEKVIGWAGHPIESIESPGRLVPGFRAAWWTSTGWRAQAKPNPELFCNANNDCEYGQTFPNDLGEPAGPCRRRDLTCWYHHPVMGWKTDCAQQCGNELLRFDPGYPYQEDGTSYPPNCTLNGLPANALIIDDVPDGTPAVRPDCGRPWTNQGTFTMTFRQIGEHFPGKIDTHQIGGGFGGHFWFAHTQGPGGDEFLEVKANWKLNRTHTGPMKILVALPDHGAHTNLAKYVVKTARGDRDRIVRQPGEGNRWVSLGAFMFNGVPEVTISSLTPDGNGEQDIAFDAIAFVPISGQYREESVEAVAVFDEDQNIDTAAPGSWLAGPLGSRESLYQWAHATATNILAHTDLPSATRQAITNWKRQIEIAGTDPVNHPDGTSMATWIGFGQPFTDRPQSDQRPSLFDDLNRFKIKLKATVSFITGDNEKIIPGSEFATYEHHTGNTHLPQFVLDLFSALEQDYSIARPNLWYRMPDLNLHDGAWRTADPSRGGILPGRAYAWGGKAPQLVDSGGAPSQDNATCVKALATAGGSIGYRPMLSQSGPTDAMQDWVVNRINNDGRMPDDLKQLARDIRHFFFNPGAVPGGDASLFISAPPIWQELYFKACADGTVQRIQGEEPGGRITPVLRASFMPDQYLYHNGRATDLEGRYTASSQPVMRGDFYAFSKDPYAHGETPYGGCDANVRGERVGNPWIIQFDDAAGVNPPFSRFCLSNGDLIRPDPSHSS